MNDKIFMQKIAYVPVKHAMVLPFVQHFANQLCASLHNVHNSFKLIVAEREH